MTEGEKSVLSLFVIGVLIVVGKVLAGGEPITARLFIGRMLLGGFVSMVAGWHWCSFPTCRPPPCADLAPCWVSPVIRRWKLRFSAGLKKGKAMAVIKTHPNVAAFLDTLAFSEGTATHPLTKNNGYDVIVTGIDGKPEIFTDYRDHPFAGGRPAKVFNRRGEKSTASGRYQQLYLFWPHYKKQLALPDFSPVSQDRLAIQLIRERGALEDLQQGRIERAISRCRNIWASLPGAGYGQREHSLDRLVAVWRKAGGVSA